MLARYQRQTGSRRGVVLILILGMLGLMSLIGVTFATFAGQSQINARNFARGLDRPGAEPLMDFALAQLINDTNNPNSALRGHSLLRDMYGNDSKMAGNAALFNAYLQSLPDGSPLLIDQVTAGYTGPNGAFFAGMPDVFQVRTNISTGYGSPTLFGLSFDRWILRVGPFANRDGAGEFETAQTFEVLEDNNLGAVHILTLRGNDNGSTINHLYAGALGYVPPNDDTEAAAATPFAQHLAPNYGGGSFVATNPVAFTLDGRYLNAFNGPGINQLSRPFTDPFLGVVTAPPSGQFPNFRINGSLLTTGGDPSIPAIGDPNFAGMDEDYDACDLENWFLAIQSADGRVVVPSFHRPGIIRVDSTINPVLNDWRNPLPTSAARFLRPRAFDHPSIGLPDLIPDATTGSINYDVDNDGDGVTDSVWLDLGYPPVRDASGRMYKPLFAFMVLGLNGRLPLNTVGNLQARDLGVYTSTAAGKLGPNLPMFDHTSHLGQSPSEINPKFALQAPGTLENQVDNLDNSNAITAESVPIWTTQLRNLLAGTRPTQVASQGERNYVLVGGQSFSLPNGMIDSFDFLDNSTTPVSVDRVGPATAGRWGESDFVPSRIYDSITTNTNLGTITPDAAAASLLPRPLINNLNWSNPVRAGKSGATVNPPFSIPFAADQSDDNFTANDFYPPLPGWQHPEAYNYLDRSGSLGIPAERFRRFVTPIDLAGIGRMVRYNTPTSILDPYGVGADARGRVSFYRYFRPAGTPGSVVNGTNWVTRPDDVAVRNPQLNPYHGYDAYRLPKGIQDTAAVPPQLAGMMGGMPMDWPQPPPVPGTALGTTLTFPTFVARNPAAPLIPVYPRVHSSPTFREFAGYDTAYPVRNALPIGNPGVDEADEMNLYAANPNDAPFGPADLEWLYRKQDVDGASLDSRLARLAPVSFLNTVDGQTRRRLFSIDSWETNHFIWAADNPNNAFPANSLNNGTLIASNGSYESYSSLSVSLGNTLRSKPPLAHRDRKINLNFPLPISNEPNEPVRRKWIANAYEFLKTILPPRATDTPEELAELSQFLVNVVDFRDGDATCTRFENYDLTVQQATLTPSAHARVVYRTNSADPALEQFGMEKLPVAINEVLAFQTKYKKGSGAAAQATPYPRMYIELVNMLQDPDGGTNNSDLDLAGWRVMITPDTPLGRPNPVTGQLALAEISANYPGIRPVPIADPNPALPATGRLSALGRGEAANNQTVGTADNHSRYYFVMANGRSDPTKVAATEYFFEPNDRYPLKNTAGGAARGSEVAPDFDLPFDPNNLVQDKATPNLMAQLFIEEASTPDAQPDTGTVNYNLLPEGDKRFKWLYLLRPANPFDPTSPLVVADAMRFPFAAITGQARTNPESNGDDDEVTVPDNSTRIYSVQRLQPYRGGHLISPTDDGRETAGPATPPSPIDAYGYSEQTTPSGQNRFHLVYESEESQNPNATDHRISTLTPAIGHTIGSSNNPNEDLWDYFPFHDRDFQSVAELLLVPGCPPGLFTKKFVENPPPFLAQGQYFTTANYPSSEPTNLDEGRQFPRAGENAIPRTYPYLVDKFYYTAASDANHTGGSHLDRTIGTVDGYTSAGWHKMFELFEVPTPAFGSLGLVEEGQNFDWYRQDVRPGMLNLNLIVDQEVFLGLLDEPRLNLTPVATAGLPRVVNQIDSTGYPNASHPIAERGFFYPNRDDGPGRTATAFWYSEGAPVAGISQAFSDFLKLRHGGSGFLFANSFGAVGGGPYVPNPSTLTGAQRIVAGERPFRSLSFPDINFTVMRPGPLPPSALTSPVTNLVMPALSTIAGLALPGSAAQYRAADPGVKNPYLSKAYLAAAPGTLLAPTFTDTNEQAVSQPPPIPPRRLFAIPDVANVALLPADKFPANRRALYNSNAAQGSVLSLNPTTVDGDYGHPEVNLTIDHLNLANPFGGLVFVPPPPVAPAADQLFNTRYLGANNVATGGNANDVDSRAHPAYRTQMLQKVMNLTTVRTHQFAVWITVGFFEVIRPGNPSLGQADLLGPEIGLLGGSPERYRSFFVIDRTRAVGFNPLNPIDFRSVVTYRRTIE